jgi:hypothetical protein
LAWLWPSRSPDTPPPAPPKGFYLANLLRISCPATTAGKAFSTWTFLKMPRNRGSSVDLAINYKRAQLPAGSTCTASLMTSNNGWNPLSITVLLAY